MENQKRQNSFLLFFIIFLTSFWLWYITSSKLDYKTSLSSDSGKNIILESINSKLIDKNLDLGLFWEVYNVVTKNYYASDSLVASDLQYGVITGFVNALWDKFSEFFPPEETKQFNEVLAGDFEWIGAVINKHELGVQIERVIKWSPALEWGLLQGDIVIEANGIKLQWLTTTQAVNHIKGPEGSKVVLKILRSGEKDFITKELVRKKITIPSVDTQDLKDPSIAYISLNMFGEHTSEEFDEILKKYNTPEVKGIIIDLRDNGGGYLQSSVEILSHFIEKGKVLVTTKYKNSKLDEKYYSENFWEIFNKKVVILINENSASASEIMAGAMRDHNKAILVGEKSFGKGSVQQPFNFSDGSMLKLTIAKWYTPNDVSIDHNGIEPDITVSFEKEDYEKKYDRQLEKAKEVLKKYIELDNIQLTTQKFATGATQTPAVSEKN